MTRMVVYYISRTVLSGVVGVLLALTGFPWWIAALTSLAILVFFLWSPHSGRYVVQPEHGATALRRDERTQAIVNQAARNAFGVTMLVIGGLVLYFGLIAPADVPLVMLQGTLILGLATYLLCNLFLQRS